MYFNERKPSQTRWCQRVDKVDTLTEKRKWTQTRNHEAGSTFGTAMSDGEASKAPKIPVFGTFAKNNTNIKAYHQNYRCF